MTRLTSARASRNDLLHALPVPHGLQRRRKENLGFGRNFFNVEDLRTVRDELLSAPRKGSAVLYSDGGAAIEKWYETSEHSAA